MSFSIDKDSYTAPEWIRNHPEFRKRDIVFGLITRPVDCNVYTTYPFDRPGYVVKVIQPGSEEVEIYRRLQQNPASPNHTLPCEIFESDNAPPLMLLPLLDSAHAIEEPVLDLPLSKLLHFTYQVLEGLAYLHSMHIAHLDMALGNVMVATPKFVDVHRAPLPLWKAYIIDFDRSRQLGQGPGIQRPIQLPLTQYDPPNGMTSMDPYSWDVYCAGLLCEDWFAQAYSHRPRPRITFWITRWMMGKERGCVDACHCRPSAGRAKQVLGVIYWVSRVCELVGVL